MTSTTQEAPRSGLKYQPQLSGLRICGVFFVMIYHYSTHLMNFRTTYDLGSFIIFFFVLSSYLITRILLNAKQKAANEGIARGKMAAVFIFRRTLRIFPAYYLYLIILMLLPLAGAEARSHAGMYFSYLSNFQLFSLKTWDTYTVHFWTLSVEEQFYLSWPWLILFIPNRRLPWFFGSLIAVAVIFRITMTSMMTDHLRELFPMLVLTPACVDSFGIGAMLALLHHQGKTNNSVIKRVIWVILPVWLFLVISKTGVPLFIGIDRLFISLLAILVVDTANRGYKGLIKIFLENRVIQYLSKISYGIYIYHMIAPVFVLALAAGLEEHFGGFGWLVTLAGSHRTSFPLAVLMAIGCATISWYCLEVPINRLKNVYTYFIPKKKKPPVIQPVDDSPTQSISLR